MIDDVGRNVDLEDAVVRAADACMHNGRCRTPPATFLEPPTAVALQGAADHCSRLGQTIGCYRLTEMIAIGGMGTVYRAARDDGMFEQDVAVKILHPSLLAPESRERFEVERKTLARLEHSSITRLLDGGTTADASPYLVMEFVRGRTLLAHCDQDRLSVDERLDLFRRICEAVQYAHQHLIVHRDLKPSNILVEEHGTPKLLDFGIAKLLDQSDAPTDKTAAWMRAMTPQYASPEQVRGEPVTTASDIYSLGVILYELLTGVRPYDTQHCSPSEIERLVCETDPPAPSSVVRAIGARARAAQNGSLQAESIQRLRRRLRGDLDTIIFKAMHKDPQRRYATVAELSEDIARHMASLPVTARPDRLGYRAQKFIRRNAAAVAAAATIGLLLVAGTIGTSVGLKRATDARAVADAHAEQALYAQHRAARVSRFLESIFASANPTIGRGPDASLRELLDDAAPRVEVEFADDPAVRSRIHATLGRTCQAIGMLDQALTQFEKALAIQRNVNDDVAVRGAALIDIAGIHVQRCELLTATKYYNEAFLLLRSAPGNAPEHVRAMNGAGWMLLSNEEDHRALRQFQRALALGQREIGESHVIVARTLNGLATAHAKLGNHATADAMFARALRIVESSPDRTDVDLLSTRANIAWLRHQQGRLDEAAAHFERLLQHDIPEDYFQRIVVRMNYAELLIDMGRIDQARQELQFVCDAWTAILGPDDCRSRTACGRLAELETAGPLRSNGLSSSRQGR